ncbi:MAG TPA: prolipoprotein diacylglyceryl transferase [bacterium]|nr:prolipoprotein diacylglyceryl transferase [bacterium]
MVYFAAMNPIAVHIGPLVIRWYGLMMAATILVGTLVALRMGPRLGVPAAEIDRLTLPFLLMTFVGARLGYVVSHPAEFTSPLEILRVWHGGLTSHGAIVGGFLALWWTSRTRDLPLWSLADITAWAIPIGNIFVRFGNFMNGELYGDVTTLPWGVVFSGVVGARHPLQLYEMLWAVIVIAIALPLTWRSRFPGQVFWTIITLVSAGRIVFDLLRSEDRIVWVITLGQIPAAILLLLGIWFLARSGRTT